MSDGNVFDHSNLGEPSKPSYCAFSPLSPGPEFYDHYQQRVRELEFYQTILDMMDVHPNFVLPENEMTRH
jgi:hypothetical protein